MMSRCKYFYNALKKYGIVINSGFNCCHPEQKELHYEQGKKIGCCDMWNCPLLEHQHKKVE